MSKFNDETYIIILTILIMMIIIYGNSIKINNSLIEYNLNNYSYHKSLNIFEKYLQKYNNKDNEFIDITHKINLTHCLIPNIENIYFINIKPFSAFNIPSLINHKESKIMIIFNHNFVDNDLTLILNKDTNDEYNLYDVNKKTSILNIYPIYNNSDKKINLSIFILKKSHWHF